MSLAFGTRLGPYEVLEPLGAGGMGEVYGARDSRLGRSLAIKVLPTAMAAEDEARRRLLREAQMAAQLNHPNICTIYDVGEAGGLAYIAMERVEGRTLDALIDPRGLPVQTVTLYGAQIADALDCAHRQGVVHRDLKSANIIVTADGRVKVLDFGLAKRTVAAGVTETTQSAISRPGEIAGTLQYMAPEILRGAAANARSDLWSLGVVLYEMASGARPFRGAAAELGAAILNEPPDPLPARVPRPLAGIIERCLAKDPQQRFRQAGEVRAALEGLEAAPRSGLGPIGLRRRSGWMLAGVGGLTLVIALGLVATVLRGRLRPSHGVTSLAVLPFDDFSGDPHQQYFADGMTDELITALAQIGSLRVISRTSVMGLRGSKRPLPEIARTLGVEAIVEGSVQRSADRVRVTAQLIRAANDEHLWAQSYERDARDVLGLEDDVARSVATEVQGHLGAGSGATPPRAIGAGTRAVSPRAYDLYLRGLAAYRHWEKQSNREALALLTQAVDEDSTYAPAWAVIGLVYADDPGQFGTKDEDVALARRAIERALTLDPNLGLAYAAKGQMEYFLDWNWSAAERDLRRAIQLAPSNFEAHHIYSHLLMSLGRVPESEGQSRAAFALNPLDPEAVVHVGWFYFFTGRTEDAIRQFQAALRLDPTFAEAYRFLASAYALTGRYEEADAALGKALGLTGSSDTTSTIVQLRSRLALKAVIAARQGRTKDALAIVDRMIASGQPPYNMATVYALLGKKDEAFRWLDSAITGRGQYVVGFGADPFLVSLHGDPRFGAALRRIGLPG